ncbi:MAG: hypothetical protein LBL53_01135 [Endomicrobium sp.]|jgi:MtN3 and saliva related transmembrane protein|nr:hypothetical protein [Endomicrobium sp.]
MKNNVAGMLYTIANVLCIIAVFPQIVKIMRTKSAKDLSLIMLMTYLISNTLLMIFALMNKSTKMVLSNLGLFILTLWEICIKLLYDRK